MLSKLRDLASISFRWMTEVPMPLRGDLRAWDAGLVHDSLRIGVDAETRIRDVQAVDRRVMRKLRDSGWDRAILLVAATRSNRAVMREFGHLVRSNFPVSQPQAISALADGADPGGNALIML